MRQIPIIPLFKKSRQRLVLSSHSRQKYFKLKGQFTLQKSPLRQSESMYDSLECLKSCTIANYLMVQN